MSKKYSSSAMRSDAAAMSSCVSGAWMRRYASPSGERPYLRAREGGIAEAGVQVRSASRTASRTARWVSVPFNPYTGTMPFKRTFLSRGSKEGLIMDGAPVPQRLLMRP